LKKAVELDPELVPALIYLSKLYMEDRNYTDTIELLERAAAKAPDNHGVQMNLGVAYRGLGRLEEAARAYQTAIALDSENYDPYYNLGILYGDYTKEYDKAIESFEMYVNSKSEGNEIAEEYLAAISLEKQRAEKRRLAAEKRKKREAERAERKRLLEEEKAREAAEEAKAPPEPEPEPIVEPAQEQPVEETAPTDEAGPGMGEAPSPEPEPNPTPTPEEPPAAEPVPEPTESSPDNVPETDNSTQDPEEEDPWGTAP
jgi:cytochrome c-type biogenesis protein CcmH/NrfG